jgi:hypothetical protein
LQHKMVAPSSPLRLWWTVVMIWKVVEIPWNSIIWARYRWSKFKWFKLQSIKLVSRKKVRLMITLRCHQKSKMPLFCWILPQTSAQVKQLYMGQQLTKDLVRTEIRKTEKIKKIFLEHKNFSVNHSCRTSTASKL